MAKNDINNKDMHPFVEESIRILHEAHLSKKLVLFVGAGVDRPSGLPLWSEATEKFMDRLHLEDGNVDNLRLPQYYYNSRGKKEYVELCRDIFLYEKELPINEIHREIISFNVNTIITTNYTNFLEREMKSRGYIYRVISQDKDLPYAKNENLIIKMHGDFEHDNFVLKEDDYLRYSDNFRLIETYIKSIIAKNVVLFIGYSFNDPDVKQLFSWVKDILGTDFQNAYMLEGYAEYDKNVFEYYKNLGVNVIYTKTAEGNEQDDLLKMLNRIEVGDKGNLSNMDTMINYFTPYLDLNYILSRYINRGIRQCNLLVENGILISLSELKDNESDKILSELIDQSTGKMLSSSEKYGTIIDMLQKSGVEAIEITNWKGVAGESKYFEVQHIENDLFNLILEFNYDELRKNVEYGDLDNSEEGHFYLQQAYLYYILEKYEKAYKALKIAAELLFEKQQYYLYYIAQFNKHRIKQFINGWNYKVSEKVRNRINEELKKVDLDDILMNMPDLSADDNQMLKDVGSFQLHYSLFQEAYRLSEKVKEQQNTEYRFFAGTPNYIRMQWLVKDYYKYLMYNFLMVDRYQESKEVLVLYVKSIMESATTPDKGKDNNSTGNIHASRIGIFEIFLMIKYMSEKDILNMFRQHEIDIIPMEDECNDYVKTVLNNLRLEKSLRCQNELWNCVAIIAYMCPNSELVEDTIDCISDQFSFVNYRTHKSIIIRFLNACQQNKRFKEKEEGVFKYDDYALGRFLKNLIGQVKDVHGNEVVDYSEIIQYVASILSGTYEEYYNENLQSIINKENNLIIARIYPYCDKKNQKLITEHLRKCKKDVSQKSCEIYLHMVMNQIIEPDKNYEQQIFDYLSAMPKNDYDIFPTDYQDILTIMFNLYLNDMIVHTEIFKNILIGAEDDVLLFMSEKESFDYEKFNLEWLQKCNSKLLEDIAHNEVARYKISRKFAEEIEKGIVDSKLLKLYFKYFANIKDLASASSPRSADSTGTRRSSSAQLSS